MLTVKVLGLDAAKRSLAGLARDVQEKALRPALNKTADKGRAEIARLIPQEFAVKAAEVRSAMDLRKAQGGNLQAVIDVFGSTRKRGRSLNLIHFLAAYQAVGMAIKTRGAKASKKELAALKAQLGFLIKKGGGLKKIEGAFIGNKGRTVFMREGRARLPIKPAQVIGFSQMFNSERIKRKVIDKVNREFPVELDRAIKMLLARL